MTDYGADFDCFQDLNAGFVVLTGRTVLIQALYRRITTPRGGLFYDPNYGTDVRQWINIGTKPGDIARFNNLLDAEYLKDQRVKSSRTSSTFLSGIARFTSIVVDGVGPFSLVLSVDAVTVQTLSPST